MVLDGWPVKSSIPRKALLLQAGGHAADVRLFRAYNDWLAEFCARLRRLRASRFNLDDVEDGSRSWSAPPPGPGGAMITSIRSKTALRPNE